MLLLLALIGCNNPETADVAPPNDGVVHADHARAPGDLRPNQIRTRIHQGNRPARVAPPPPPLPDGQAVYTDCGAGPWRPRSVLLDDSAGADDAEGDLARPTPRPRPPSGAQPAPQPSPSPAPAPAMAPKPSPKPLPTTTAKPAAPPPAKNAPDGYMTMPDLFGEGAGRGGGGAASGPAAGEAAPVGGLVGRGSATTGADAPNSAPRPAEDPVQPEAEPTPDAGRYGGAEQQKQLENLGYVADKSDAGEGRTGNLRSEKKEEKAKDRRHADGDDDGAAMIAEIDEVTEEEAAEAYWDWGATVHLSNDDSMSLASAQRVLWSAMNKRTPKVSEIRPHELLNYFSFETVPVPEGELFSVLGSGKQDGDTLSVALAVQGALPKRQPLDLTLVVDTSGSMYAEGRMDYTRRGLNQMIDRLHVGDRIDLVTFESRTCTTLTDYVVGRDDPGLLRHAMGALTPKGSTDLNGGLREAYRIQRGRSARDTHGRNKRVMLITDAFLNTGSVNPDVVSEIGAAYEDDGIRITGIGVGRDFNDEVLDKLTEKGKGAYVYLGSEGVVDRVFGAGFDSLVQTIAHDVRFSLHLPPSLAMERFYGEEASTNAEDIQPIHYYAGTSQVFLQDLHIRDKQLVLSDPIKLRIAWRDAVTGEPDSLELQTTVGALVDSDSANLRKAQALMAWTDFTQAWAMNADPCGDPRADWHAKADTVVDDAELTFLDGLVTGICGTRVAPPQPVAYKVKVDSDVPIQSVTLTCGRKVWTERMGGGDTVARFEEAHPGSCTVTLVGATSTATQVSVPKTGGDARCLVRGGRLSCT